MNLLIYDKNFQSSYLAKSAAGTDDKGRVKRNVSSTAGVTNIPVQEPQIEKIQALRVDYVMTIFLADLFPLQNFNGRNWI